MPGPNFFVIGAAKSGTTALYHALRQHEDVFLPDPKEPHFYAYLVDPPKLAHLFADEAAARRSYAGLYDGVTHETAIGDASTSNLHVAGTAATIAADVPDARIVVILRQPVDRAFSHWAHFRAAGADAAKDFAHVVREETARQRRGAHFTYQYMGWGRYSAQLPQFFDAFGRERVLVHLYDDFCADGPAVVRDTLRFLGVDATGAIAPIGRHNERRVPRSVALQRALQGKGRAGRMVRAVLPSRPRIALSGWTHTHIARKLKLDPALRAELTLQCADEIARLEELLDRDLSAWR